MLSRILIPLDGSAEMTAALPEVRQFVSGSGANIRLLLVRPMPQAPERRSDRWAYLDDLVREEYATWQGYLRHHGSALAYDGIVVEREVRFGELLPEILTATARHASHLIALAAPTQSWGERLVRPGLTQQLMRRAAIPVLVVPSRCELIRGLGLRYSGVVV
jgi:nucleotide-binding universal stress UspA family protein